MLHVVPLRYGTAFKKAFSDPDVFSAFASDVLGVALRMDHIEQEHAFRPPVGRVDIRYALFAEDASQRVIVEIQHIRERDTFDRFLYYHLIGQVEQMHGSSPYRFERTVYTVVVLTRLPEEEHLRFDVAVQDSDIVDKDGRKLGAYRHRLVFLNARCVNASTPPGVRKWLELIDDTLDERLDEKNYPDAMLQRVIAQIQHTRLSPEEAFRLKEESEWEETKREAARQGREEGHERGLEEGREQGREQGREEGREEGREQGLAAGREQEAVRRLREAVVDLAELLGLPLSPDRERALDALDRGGLEGLRAHLKQHRAWPAG